MNAEAARLVVSLGLAPLPKEGGFFARTWTGPVSKPGGRSCGTGILFLITDNDFSALHRLLTDEVWHYHAGDPADLVTIDPAQGTLRVRVLGPDVLGGHHPQAVVGARQWQGARPHASVPNRRGWTLFGCTMAPGWKDEEFELGSRDRLLRDFPAHGAWIRSLTR